MTDFDALGLKEQIFDRGEIGHKKSGKFLKKLLGLKCIVIAQRNQRLGRNDDINFFLLLKNGLKLF